ncbi:MAG: 4Fe-4S dicluster domain-containing protein [Gemmatimonadetes bacterium]|uniref:4Fe-4S dicluster domain-containing protein n=1 Tax=Candidatus Kutchimonas denitrificans TaxID=3056748 RepID=A0AAE4ZA77_9BACT|nr:4Fe-4S dicluster domain-containing protein [Gemmatimonadota bacterium]NIR74396.1 4Fe-4S dicluster domain-containing protein [Candidatus Kutchimonas denitrificans]NIS02647.1 4Fe-4S dicluster domain-containing protein [Gemmatimonadota bacterium]NIT68522.1 4Fe-4S dicluster domain-containing protein [Gemmatimonadota bacterium]NIU51999.1 4Fe-4S dicluster domain-containing protein [Gemmatimonadota bacterium]
MPNSFVFDSNRCTGCDACRLACSIENGLGPDRSWRRVETFNPKRHPALPAYHLSLACNHCNEPACLYACPANAYRRDAHTGAVILEEEKCIGCRYCSWACPYDAPVFDSSRGVMSKCTFCNHRLVDGLEPACVALCPTGALGFADVAEPEIENEIDGFPATELGPRTVIVPLKEGRWLPVMSAPVVDPASAPGKAPDDDIRLRSEWPLAAFTSMLAVLVAALAAATLDSFDLSPAAFVGGAALILGLASLHLGKPFRAYRALLNLRRSWLSREVTAVTGFIALAAAQLLWFPGSWPLAAVAVGLGLTALICADYVYTVLRASAHPLTHSASVAWTGVFLAAVFAGVGPLAGAVGLGKLGLYVGRKLGFRRGGRPVRPAISLLRVGVGLVVPGLLWAVDPARFHELIVAAVVAGELVDRAEYYVELERIAPSRQMSIDLERRIAEGGANRDVPAPRPALAAID